MIEARHNLLIYSFFRWYSGRMIRKHFRRVEFKGHWNDEGGPLLILANHVSWWDGFWIAHLNHTLLKRKLHFMMLEENLRKHWYFSYCGGFSIQKGRRSVLLSLEYAARLLTSPRNMLFLFPQGELESMHQQEIRFENGVERLLSLCPAGVQVLFLANLVDYGPHPKPALHMYLQSFDSENLTSASLEEAYGGFYRDCLSKQSANMER